MDKETCKLRTAAMAATRAARGGLHGRAYNPREVEA